MYSLKIVKKMIEKRIGSNKKITAESNFSDLGIDKIDVVDIIISLEEELNLTFDDKDMMDIETVQEVLDLIEKTTK